MAADPIHSVGDVNPDAELVAQDLDPDSADKPFEPVRPAEAPRQQALALTPSPSTLVLIGGGVAAAFAGGAVGYWLGKRRSTPPARPIRRAAATFESAAALAPVAMHLLANPLVRTLAIRILLRQISRRIDH